MGGDLRGDAGGRARGQPGATGGAESPGQGRDQARGAVLGLDRVAVEDDQPGPRRVPGRGRAGPAGRERDAGPAPGVAGPPGDRRGGGGQCGRAGVLPAGGGDHPHRLPPRLRRGIQGGAGQVRRCPQVGDRHVSPAHQPQRGPAAALPQSDLEQGRDRAGRQVAQAGLQDAVPVPAGSVGDHRRAPGSRPDPGPGLGVGAPGGRAGLRGRGDRPGPDRRVLHPDPARHRPHVAAGCRRAGAGDRAAPVCLADVPDQAGRDAADPAGQAGGAV